MNKIEYINNLLKLNSYENMETYVDRRSNEILFDEVWLWRTKVGIKEDFPQLNDGDVINILKLIMQEIIEKGGVIVDYSEGEAEKIIKKFNNINKDELIDKIADFLLHNPDYGDDGNGIWFE